MEETVGQAGTRRRGRPRKEEARESPRADASPNTSAPGSDASAKGLQPVHATGSVAQTSPTVSHLVNHADILSAVPHCDDVVEYTLRCASAIERVDDQARKVIDRHVRGLFSGTRTYISSRNGDGTVERNNAIRRDYQRGERIELLSRRYGLSTVQLWRIINNVPNH